MHGLAAEELRELHKWPDARLIDAFEGYGDLVYLMELQDVAGVKHKSATDPDVASLVDTYHKLKGELEKRLKLSSKALATTLEGHTRTIAHNTAYTHGALGIPDDEKSNAQIAQAKADYNSTYVQIETAMSK